MLGKKKIHTHFNGFLFFLLLKTKGVLNLREMKLVEEKRDCILWLDVFSESPVSLIILVKHPTKIGLYLGSGIYSILHFLSKHPLAHFTLPLSSFHLPQCVMSYFRCIQSFVMQYFPSSKFHCLEIEEHQHHFALTIWNMARLPFLIFKYHFPTILLFSVFHRINEVNSITSRFYAVSLAFTESASVCSNPSL